MKKMKRAICFLIICAMSFSGTQTVKGKETVGVSVEDIYASETNMATLYFEPKAYEEKRTFVTGYLELNGEDSALYMTQEDLSLIHI